MVRCVSAIFRIFALAAIATLVPQAMAQAPFPSRPIKLVVPYPPAALTDLANTFEDQASQRLAALRVILFPLMLFIVGGFVGLVTAALFLPLVTTINNLTGS